MKLYNIFFVTFNLIFLRLCSSESSNDDLPIETVYPKCYNNKDKPSGIMVHKEFFDPIHGYAITPFKDNEVNRNNFRPRKPYDEIKIIVLHFTGDSFANTINRFYLRNTHYPSSAHYLITRPTEAEAHKQLLQVNHFHIFLLNYNAQKLTNQRRVSFSADFVYQYFAFFLNFTRIVLLLQIIFFEK